MSGRVPSRRGAWIRRTPAAVAVACVVGAGCATAPPAPPPAPVPAVPNVRALPHLTPLAVRVKTPAGAVLQLPLDEYVGGAVAAELSIDPRPHGGDAVALEVQVLVARTYALANRGRHGGEGFDLCATTHCQIYAAAPEVPPAVAAAIARAIARTRGQVIAHHATPIQALFHASCGGRTSEAEAVWGGLARPYLRSVVDEPCRETARPWRFAADTRRLRAVLNADRRTRVGAALFRIDVVARDAAGRAIELLLAGERAPIVRGEEFRVILARTFGAAALRSTAFDVIRAGDRFEFEGRGFGHGVGLCQAGALALARAGRSAGEILQHYFPGTRLVRVD